MKQIFQKVWPEIAAILFFILLSFFYFVSPISKGYVLTGEDNTAAVGAGHEIGDHFDQTGEVSRWTNALFCGMPTYQIAPRYGSRSVLNTMRDIYDLGLPHVVMYVFILLLGFYILMRAMNFKPLLSVVGAIAWAFSSYFFIIIGAGHIWKVLTLAFIPPTLAGIILCYRGKYLWGGSVTALFLTFQILSNHLQMTYYFLPVIFLMVLAYFVQALKQKQLGKFWKASGVLFVATVIAVAANASNMYHTYTYSKESMRGKCELAPAGTSKSSGLSKEYITQWSYGIGETWTLLVPNTKGGASVPLALNEKAMQKAKPEYRDIYAQIGQYWGEQPGTSGPVYVGAFVLLLFILGLFIVKGPMKWALLFATILSILLSWGHNFMGFTEFFIDHVPLYNKFRTVSSILVVAEFCIPMLAVMTLAKIVQEPELLKKKSRWFYLSFGLTAGICLLFALMPTVFFSSFISSKEQVAITNAFSQNPEVLQGLLQNLSEVRQSIFTSDAWRSFVIVTIGAILLWLYRRQTLKANVFILLVGILCLGDMYAINKRYLNDRNFEARRPSLGAPQETETDQLIKQDTDPYFRVLNLASNTFNENETSYYHKSIGGYNAAKLGRYQDLINYHIAPEMDNVRKAIYYNSGNLAQVNSDTIFPVLNMLNAKYFIVPIKDNRTVPIANPQAFGNAWFVQDVQYVDNANAEIQALKQMDLRHQAVADAAFKEMLGENTPSAPIDSTDQITLTSYSCNELKYNAQSKQGGLAVFSEIYYPEWTATLDGQPVSIGRVNYTLRGIRIPAGKHELKMEFRPASVEKTEAIAYGAIVVLILSFLSALFMTFKNLKKSEKKEK